MIRSTEPVIIMTRAELDAAIESAARAAAVEVLRNLPNSGSQLRPHDVNQTQAAKMIGCSRDTIRAMLRARKLTLNEFGKIPIEDIDRAIASKAA